MKRIHAVAALLLGVSLLFSSARVAGESITVNATCGLADAINAANDDVARGGCQAGNGADTITLTGNVSLSAALPWIDSDITVDGDNYGISGGSKKLRIFSVSAGSKFTVQDVTLRDGNAGSSDGGAIYAGRATIIVKNSQFINNRAGKEGGAIYVYAGNVQVSGSSFNANSATLNGGAIYAYDAAVTVIGSSFVNNSIGAYNKPDAINSGKGGAINVYDASPLTIRKSFFSGNRARAAGNEGGVVSVYEGATTIANSTVIKSVGRSAVRMYRGDLSIIHNTMAENTKDLNASYSKLTLYNNILTTGYVGGGKSISKAGNLIGGDAKLGASKGSPAYLPLLAGSPAIDAAHSDHCLPRDQTYVIRPQGNGCDIGAYESSLQATKRPTAAPTATSTSTPTPVPKPISLNGAGCSSLADAIKAANTDAASGNCPAGNGADTITFLANVALREELPAVSSDITFEGGGHTLSRDHINEFRLLLVNANANSNSNKYANANEHANPN